MSSLGVKIRPYQLMGVLVSGRERAKVIRMSASRSSHLSPATAQEPTPQPASAVASSSSAEQVPESSLRRAERKAAVLEYFTSPSPEMCEMDAAWEEALALYGDEDSAAWVFALEDGTHPLCRVRLPARPA